MKLLIIANPVSGGIDKEPFLAYAMRLCKKYEIDLDIYKTTGTDDGPELKRLLQQFQPDKVAVAGGDGTILSAGLILRDTSYPMGIIPMGSANGMAKELNVALEPEEALRDLIMSQLVVGMDILVVNDRYHTLHMGDVGFNAQIVHKFDADPRRGMFTYAKHFFTEIRQLNPFPVTVRADGEELRSEALMVAVCNARKYGIGLPLNLIGSPLDGKFEIVVVKDIKLSALIETGLSEFEQMLWDCQDSEVISTTSAEIIFEYPQFLQLDGEPIGDLDRLEVKIEPAAIQLISNRDYHYL